MGLEKHTAGRAADDDADGAALLSALCAPIQLKGTEVWNDDGVRAFGNDDELVLDPEVFHPAVPDVEDAGNEAVVVLHVIQLTREVLVHPRDEAVLRF